VCHENIFVELRKNHMDIFWSAIIASMITAICSFYIMKWQVKQNEKSSEIAILRAIATELKTLNTMYIEKLSPFLVKVPERQPQTVDMLWPGGHHYFQVYTKHTTSLGAITDNELREKVIETYIVAMGLVDSLKLNSEMLHERNRLQCQQFAVGQAAIAPHIGLKNIVERLEEYGKLIRGDASIFRNKSDELLASIEDFLHKR
jgi:hypothetical protein